MRVSDCTAPVEFAVQLKHPENVPDNIAVVSYAEHPHMT